MIIRCVLNNKTAMWNPNRSYGHLLDTYIEDLLQFVEPKQIDIIYVPPVDYKHVDNLREQGINVKVYKSHPYTTHTKYAMKFYLLEDPVDDMIITDVDTRAYNDPQRLIDTTRGFAARADPCSYRNPTNTNIIDWNKYYNIVDSMGIDWRPPVICNGHMVLKRKDDTIKYAKGLDKYFNMLLDGEIEKFMPDRYIIFMASMLSVIETYPRGDIWFVSPEEISIERYEHVGNRTIFMERKRL